jgi:hypothetical protein
MSKPRPFFWVLTLQKTIGNAVNFVTLHGVTAVERDETAEQVYLRILEEAIRAAPEFSPDPVTLFWSITRN